MPNMPLNVPSSILRIAVAALCAFGCTFSSAQAAVVDFSDTEDAGDRLSAHPSVFSNQGLTFQTTWLNQYTLDGSVADPPGADNGSKFYIATISPDYHQVTISPTDGGQFSLSSLDAGLSYLTQTIDTVNLTGHLHDGGSVTRTLNLNQSFQTYSLTGFTNLNSLVVWGLMGDGYVALDNIDVTFGRVAETPIPGALPLFASALGLGGFFGWRRKRKAAMKLGGGSYN